MIVRWRQLLAPEYVLAFIDGFCIAAFPILGIATGTDGYVLSVTDWPSWPAFAAAGAVGFYNGLRSVRNLSRLPPASGLTNGTPRDDYGD